MLFDPDPPLFPADWASAWGEDAYGLWQAFVLGGERQVMRWIRPGRFRMGSPKRERGRYDNETQHEVTLTKGLWLAEAACTQALWRAVTGHNPARFTHPQHPVEQVSWDDCMAFLERANAERKDGLILRLPTEAEWEYACRAGTVTAFSFGDALTTDLANYYGAFAYGDNQEGEYRGRTLPVRRFRPNPWGLYQMHGNVWEWCSDWYSDYPAGPVEDPVGPVEGSGRVLRGGSWGTSGQYLRSADRYHARPAYRDASFGLRLAGGVDRQVRPAREGGSGPVTADVREWSERQGGGQGARPGGWPPSSA